MSEELITAQAVHKRLAAVMKPSGRAYRGDSAGIGDGDGCPVEPEHGRMLTVRGSITQHCPHQTHDGVWSKEGKAAPTRSRWPFGPDSFKAAVAAWRTQNA